MKENEIVESPEFGIEPTKETPKIAQPPPPPEYYKTKTGNNFKFGRPGLKHAAVISKAMKIMAKPTADYDAIIKCAKARKLSLEEFVDLSEDELTEDEKRAILKHSDKESNAEFAAEMNAIMAEVLFATIKETTKFTITREMMQARFVEEMDDYGECLELFPIACRWIKLAVEDLQGVNRPNL